MLWETLKQEIDKLDESQLKEIADLVTSSKTQQTEPFWQHATPEEQVQDLRTWIAKLRATGTTLTDQAFDRGSIYE